MMGVIRLLAVSMFLAVSVAPQAQAQVDFTSVDACDLSNVLWRALGDAHLDPVSALPLWESQMDEREAVEQWQLDLVAYIQTLKDARGTQAALQNRIGIRLIRNAAERGDPSAQYELARQLGQGVLGVVKNEAESLEWYRRAAHQGHGLSMAAFAASTAVQEEGALDFKELYFWMLLARSHIDVSAASSAYPESWTSLLQTMFDDAESALPAKERLLVQKRATNWTASLERDPCQ